jgi:hypothetical protein
MFLEHLITEPFLGADPAFGVPEITDIHYDVWLLRITLHFERLDAPVYVEFDGIRGFRVLDEADLLEFWNLEERVKGWLRCVKSGGWSALESTRSGFVSGITANYEEYLLAGMNDCISILAFAPPKIYVPTP